MSVPISQPLLHIYTNMCKVCSHGRNWDWILQVSHERERERLRSRRKTVIQNDKLYTILKWVLATIMKCTCRYISIRFWKPRETATTRLKLPPVHSLYTSLNKCSKECLLVGSHNLPKPCHNLCSLSPATFMFWVATFSLVLQWSTNMLQRTW